MFCLIAGIAFTCSLLPSAQAQTFWTADTSRGTSVFEGLEEAPGKISIVADPKGVHGQVYRYDTVDDPSFLKERCESRGTKEMAPRSSR